MSPLPSQLPHPEQESTLFDDEPWADAPVHMAYGTNVRLGFNVYLKLIETIFDICLVSIESPILVGLNVSFYNATHPLNPQLGNGIRGPGTGKEIHVGEDCGLAAVPSSCQV